MADILYFSYIIPHSQSLMDTERGLFLMPLVISDPCLGHLTSDQSGAREPIRGHDGAMTDQSEARVSHAIRIIVKLLGLLDNNSNNLT